MTKEVFGSILDKPASEIKRPPPMPIGTYLAVVKGLPKYDKSSKKGTEYAEFTFNILQAQDDVDSEALAEIGGIGDKQMRDKFWLTENAAYRLTEFLEEALQIEKGDKSTRQMIEEANGKQVMISVTQTPTEDGKGFFANISAYAKVD